MSHKSARRPSAHAAALEQAVLAVFTTTHPCRAKANRLPGQTALAELARLKGVDPAPVEVTPLTRYAEFARVAR